MKEAWPNDYQSKHKPSSNNDNNNEKNIAYNWKPSWRWCEKSWKEIKRNRFGGKIKYSRPVPINKWLTKQMKTLFICFVLRCCKHRSIVWMFEYKWIGYLFIWCTYLSDCEWVWVSQSCCLLFSGSDLNLRSISRTNCLLNNWPMSHEMSQTRARKMFASHNALCIIL